MSSYKTKHIVLESGDFVKCEICGLESTAITASHLKFKHNITMTEYKDLYPGAYTITKSARDKQSANISKKAIGRTAHNKGVKMSAEQRASMSDTIKDQYASGERIHWNTGKHWSAEVKSKISESVSQLEFPPEKIREINDKRAITLEHRKSLGWVSPLRGKKLSGDHLLKSRNSIQKATKAKSKEAWNDILDKCNRFNLIILSIESSPGSRINLKCTTCLNEFSFQSQIFRNSKRGTDGSICPVCFPRENGDSTGEIELANFIESLGETIVRNDRTVLGGYGQEIDVYIPSRKIGFEYNGLYWHSIEVSHLERNLHAKTTRANNAGIDIIHIFEDEWQNKQEIVKSRICQILGKHTHRLHARKLTIKDLSTAEKDDFLNDNHIQGTDRARVKFGAFTDTDELVAVMTFKPTNFTKGGDGSMMELSRFAVKMGCHIPGIASKLFKHFVKNSTATTILSYADRRWSRGNLYKQLGFVFDGNTVANYWYFKPNELLRLHRSNFMKHKLVKGGSTQTESELMVNLGYFKIFDVGSSRWLWTRPNER